MPEPFQPRFVDLVRNFTTTEGTGSFTLGSAVSGFTSFAGAVLAGERFYYSAIGIEKPAEREVGRGTMATNGSIAREPVSGTLTNFTSGTKTIALIAAAEWFEQIQAGSSSSGVAEAATRAELSALADRSRPAVLHEAGREGLFVFEQADLAAQVSADPAQGLYIAPSTDPTGTGGAWARQFDGAMQAGWFGAKGDGTSDDTEALQAAINQAGETRQLQLCGGTYKVTELLITAPDVTIIAHGALITSDRTASTATLTTDGPRTKIIGGTWKLTSGSDNPWHFDIYDLACELDGVRMVKDPAAGHYQAYIRQWADGFVMRNCLAQGADGFSVEAGDSGFFDNRLIARPVGGDDCFALKAIGDSVRNVRIEGNYIENFAAGLSIGSEIGVLAANDATYSRIVGQVVFTGNTLTNCAGIAFIKPGAISASDYRDGTVEDIVISNNTLVDGTGFKFERGIAITSGRGARVRRIYGRNNLIRARSVGGVVRLVGAIDIHIVGEAGGTTEADVSGVDLQVDYWDNYDGVANGVGGAPGYPVTYVASVSNAISGTGTMSDILIDIRGNGSANQGLYVGPGLDDAVKLVRLDLTNVNVNNAAAGMKLESRVNAAEGRVTVSPAVGSVLQLLGTGELVTTIEAGRQGGASAKIKPTASAPALVLQSPDATDEISIGNSGSDFTGYVQAAYMTSIGPAATRPSVMNVGLDISGTTGRLVAYQAGVGYRNVALDGASCVLRVSGVDLVSVTGNGMGYATGQGGTVTQITSKATGVSLNKVSGQITLNAAALPAGTTVSFTLTNTKIAAGDVLILNHVSGGTAGAYTLNAQCVAGSAVINVRNITAGSLSEAIVVGFVLIKGVTA